MKLKLRIVLVILAALATMAPVCVLAGGNTSTISSSIELSDEVLVEVFGENAEIRIHRVSTRTLELDVTLHNEEFVDFYTQALTPEPTDHFVISATTSTGGTTTANSLIEIGIPRDVELVVQTTNRPISVDTVDLASASLTTVNGEISVTNSSGNYDINTTNSEVTIQSVDGDVNVTTTNAHVWFEGVVSGGTSSISTTNGDIAVRLNNGSDANVTGSTHNGEVTINGGDEGVAKDGDKFTFEHRIEDGAATFNITNGPGAVHINPDAIAVFDGDS
ncbi:MAG: DUF4097 family beta strand repeat-containing protein [Dehalococcoidia bacterium]|jgi:DUF4097 and DUF4098 domain-containing protein YvlB|nr:hypothetical protein [Chloroflexota bacterium]MDP6056838.1 DUF4097 family beta strand repeat-containing protein [Dehalococcoidia bacterium]MDP7261805.1 DUF4097 family beta strand repeat-containing protein [Dehalococcoidia bacterium]|tara:strand:+ start:268 stop:1095 length:828 start_codon:yes stop_codon:yes gene_type:complete